MLFDGFIHSYKWTEELYTLKTISMLNEAHDPDFYAKWTFFKITNSSYIQMLVEGAEGLAEGRKFTHFLFIELNSILEIIAPAEPKIWLVNT